MENGWRNIGWWNGGYTFVILSNGSIEWNYPWTTVTNGAFGTNSNTLHICLVGDNRPNSEADFLNARWTAAQRNSLVWLIRQLGANNALSGLVNNTNLANSIFGHSTLPNITGGFTDCPGRGNYSSTAALITSIRNDVRNRWNQVTVTNDFGASTGGGSTSGNIVVGSRVQVNQTASFWATGEAVPNWVRGQSYTVIELGWNGNTLLLDGVMSWINRNDVTLIGGGATISHTVRSGETLFSISQLYGTTVLAIQQANGMGSSTVIQVGQVLMIPGATNRVHIVQAGDTLFSISQLFGTTVQAIQQANGMGSSTVIQVGQVLRIP